MTLRNHGASFGAFPFGAFDAALPPFATVVVVSLLREFGTNDEIDAPVQDLGAEVDRFHFGALGAAGGAYGFAVLAQECVLLSGAPTDLTAADVLADDLSVHAL